MVEAMDRAPLKALSPLVDVGLHGSCERFQLLGNRDRRHLLALQDLELR